MKRNGQKVKVAYKGYLEDGTLFDECKPEEAFTFVMGTSSVIPGFEKAVGSMEEATQSPLIYLPRKPTAFTRRMLSKGSLHISLGIKEKFRWEK